MIGRGVLGNPWLIKEVDTYLKEGKVIDKPSYEERIQMCYTHLDYLLKIKPERIAILEMRSHISWYIKGIPHHKEIQSLCFKAKTKEEITEILDNYLKKLYN
jgi:tRNA-dihydrouridine synthase